jgi:hypothetical protein
MAEIIKFPKMKLDSPPQSLEELSEKLTEYRTSFSNDVAESLWNLVLVEMVRSGCRFEEDTETFYPSIILLLESIRSLHLQASGIHHPLQDFAEEFIENEEIDKEMIDIGELLE